MSTLEEQLHDQFGELNYSAICKRVSVTVYNFF